MGGFGVEGEGEGGGGVEVCVWAGYEEEEKVCSREIYHLGIEEEPSGRPGEVELTGEDDGRADLGRGRVGGGMMQNST